MPYFVYYEDDYSQMGGVGLKECTSKEEAELFILSKMRSTQNLSFDRYKVIKGDILRIGPKRMDSSIEITE